MFVMCFSTGYGDDYYTGVICTFDSSRDANLECERRNTLIMFIRGLLAAVEYSLNEWSEKNPAPHYRDSAALDSWEEKRGEERVRLEKLFQIPEHCEHSKIQIHDVETAHYYVTEVPHNP